MPDPDSELSASEGAMTRPPADKSGEGMPESPRRRVLRSFTRPGRGQIIAAVILFLVAFGGVLQVRTNANDQTYQNARQSDLVQILDGLNSESRRLQGEIQSLQKTRESLRSGADRQRVARSETRKRIGQLGILAGTEKAEGQGVRITVTDPHAKLTPELMLEGVEELRDAGAEAIEINDHIRVVAATSFGGGAGNVTVDGQPISSPVVIEAIGDSDSLASGADFRGGFADQVTGNAQGQVEIKRESRVVIDSLHTPKKNQYAQPASSPSAKR